MQPYTPRPATAELNTLVMRVYPAAADADNTFSLYEDDGISLDYQKGVYATTDLQYTQTGNKATVTVHPAKGSYPGQVTKRAYKLQLPGLPENTTVKVNGKKARTGFDTQLGCLTVDVPSTSVNKSVKIEYEL